MYVIPWIVMMTCTDGDIFQLTNVCNCWMISLDRMTGSHRSLRINILWVLRLYERWESLKSSCCFCRAFVEKFMSKECVCVCVCVWGGLLKATHVRLQHRNVIHVWRETHTQESLHLPRTFSVRFLPLKSWKKNFTSCWSVSVHHVRHVLFFMNRSY